MKVAFFASEVAPYAKTGGLADVAGALPKFLARLGVEVKLFMPFYREVREKNLPLARVIPSQSLDWPGGKQTFSVLEHKAEGFSAYFVEKDEFFDRGHLYGTTAGDDPDNGERFAFYCRASLEALKTLGFPPSILHAHDWQAAPAVIGLRALYAEDPFFRKTRTLFTIHNLAYQGLFDKEVLARVGLPPSLFNPRDLEFFGKVNTLKGGILYSTAVSTVSPKYAEEIQTPEFGCGLDSLLKERADSLHGILNGVDYEAWNPATDPLIPAGFGPDDLGGKAVCRRSLLELFGLAAGDDVPVVGMVTRLAGQKGLDIVCEALPDIFGLGLRLVILGTGEKKIQDFLLESQKTHPAQLGLKIAFDEKIAHTIYAGSDFFLIPSRYEPCGLTQMYSLKYGTIPVVRATGGLENSVREFDASSGEGNGFKFVDPAAPALVGALRNGIDFFGRPEAWSRLRANAMREDFSWERSASDYLRLYRSLLFSG
jgi:starch synthase